MKRRSPELPARPSADPAQERNDGDDVKYDFVESESQRDDDHPDGPPSRARRQPIRLLRLPQVIEIVGLRRAAIYKLQSEGRFPRRVKLGVRAVGWVEAEIQEWVARRIQESDSPSPTAADDLSGVQSNDD